MRCTSIEENKCWNRIKFKLTRNSIRLFVDFLHIDVVNLPFLKWVGLVGTFDFLFWAFICIMRPLIAFEAFHLTDVSSNRLTCTSTTITTVVNLMSTLVVLV